MTAGALLAAMFVALAFFERGRRLHNGPEPSPPRWSDFYAWWGVVAVMLGCLSIATHCGGAP